MTDAETVDRWRRTVREDRGVDAAMALRTARYRAGEAVVGEPAGIATPAAPCAADAPFEIRPDALGAALVRRAFETHGALLVRGLLADEVTAELRDGIDAAMAARGTDDPDPRAYAPFVDDANTVVGLRRFAAAGDALLLADSPALLRDVLQVFDTVGLRDLIIDYLGERPAISVMKSSLRRVERTSPGGWHQDGAFLHGDIDSLNVWVALSDCGSTAPGMDVVPRRLDLLETGTEDAAFDWTIGHSVVERAAAAAGIVTPDFRAGDVLLFDHRFVHRTSGGPGTTGTRYGIECWFFPPSRYPQAEIPLLY